MNLQNINLEKWLEVAPETEYLNQKKIDYFSSYKVFKQKAILIHEEVTAGANFHEAQKGNLVFMNDHGPKHIDTVITRASKLVDKASVRLSPQEIYFLLTAIHLHDIGNLYGRMNHVDDLSKVLPELEAHINLDTINIRYIRFIAQAHGGKTSSGDKDKIETLPEVHSTLEGEVRMRLLASILRLADELADDKYRCNVVLLKNGGLGESEIYHAYSYCLSNVIVDNVIKQIELQFHIPDEFAVKRYDNGEKKAYLIDEIYSRVLKMHHERHYTMRFTRGLIDLTSILVRIEFYPESTTEDYQLPERITFELKETGYPNSNNKNIFGICNNLIQNGIDMNGKYFKDKISNLKKQAKKKV
jgi:hypothetical protein